MTDEGQARINATVGLVVPPRSLFRRALLLYRPERTGAWKTRALFYLFAFVVVPFLCLAALGAYVGPDETWGGVPAVLLLVFVTLFLRRRAVLADGRFRLAGNAATAGAAFDELPFRLEEPPPRRPLLGVLSSIAGTALVCGGFMGSSLAARKGVRLLELGRGLRARDGRERLRRRAGEPPVLLLRSFEDEEMGDPRPLSLLMRRYEETLSRALEIFGPVITIGRPGDSLPFGGAGRLYVSDQNWRRAVRHLMAHAGVVVIIAGRTEGLWWEIDEAFEAVDRERLLFFFPHVLASDARNKVHERWAQSRAGFEKMERERRDRYRVFRQRIAGQVAGGLPDDLGKAVLVDFLADGEARLLGPRYPSVLQYLMGPFMGAYLLADFFTLPRNRRLRFDMARTVSPFVAKLYETAE